ncbi:MAG: aldose 1-epimerase [Paraglaciecola sp.]|jgi:aldose 1-epimerase
MISRECFGVMPDGQQVEQFSLSNEQGVSVEILNLGGIIRRWLVPVSNQEPVDIVLGFDTLAEYLADDSYLGTVVGRYANRIAKGRFSINDRNYKVDVNQGGNCLHGGSEGFHHRVWHSEITSSGNEPALMLSLTSQDGDQGFPGQLDLKVCYTLSAQNTLRVEYFALSDKDTVFNPTQHSYFNLAGHDSGKVHDQQIQVFASHFTPTDSNAIPTGEIADVSNTPFDLRQLTRIAVPLSDPHEQIKIAQGLDHNWCLNAYQPGMRKAAVAAIALDPVSGRKLRVSTTMPGIQLYTGNFLDAEVTRKNAAVYPPNQAFCFETQFYPDAPNQASFPSPLLKAGEEFYSVTEFTIEF